MSRSFYPFAIGAAFFLCLLIVPASAILQEVTVKSTVATVNQAKNTLTIGNPLQYGCSYPASGGPECTWTPMNASSLTGTVPDPSAFTLFKPGDPIAGTSIGGPGGSWIALAKLYGSRPNEEFITDIIGDPGTIPIPLIGDYALKADTVPDCALCSGAACTANSSDVAVSSRGLAVSEKILSPGQTLFFNGRNDGSIISVTFVKGEASSSACPQVQKGITGVQPVSLYLVTLVPPIGYGQVNIRTATTTRPDEALSSLAGTVPATTALPTSANPVPVTTPQAGSQPVGAISALGIAGILLLIKKH